MQVVGYETSVRDLSYDPADGVDGEPRPPALFVADDGDVRRVDLAPGAELAFRLRERHCAGSHDGDRHDPCGAAEAPHCPVHASTWLCAQCRGDCQLPLESCREEHAVYLAAFAPATFKVGVTRLWRLPARLREQGADRAAHVHTVSNGRIARSIEAELAESLADRVGVGVKVDGVGSAVDRVAWEGLLDDYAVIEEFEFDYGLDLDSRPLRETMATGRVRGAKGRLVVLDHGGATYAVDLRDLVGYEVAAGGPDPELQSSLGAFG